VDQVVFGAQEADISYARCPNGVGTFEKIQPTFGANNDPACAATATESAFEKQVKIFPNPTSGQVTVQAPGLGQSSVSLCSMLGQPLLHKVFMGETVLETGSLAPGMYFMVVNGKGWGRLVVSR
jgi:hypothetical protein